MTNEPEIVPATTTDTTGDVLAPATLTPMSLMSRLIDQEGGGLEKVEMLERLVRLQEGVEAKAAEREFAEAFASFQEACPPVPKRRSSKKTRGDGGGFSFMFANFADVTGHVTPFLIERGFAYSFDRRVEAGALTSKCTLRHRGGHSTTAEATLPIDGQSKNSQHKVVGTSSIADRLALCAVLGLALTDDEAEEEVRYASPEQIANIRAVIAETGVAVEPEDFQMFIRHLNVSSLETLPADRVANAITTLRSAATERAEKAAKDLAAYNATSEGEDEATK